MEIILAKSAGFCFGVKRALEAVNKAIEDYAGYNIYTYGPIIHNDTVTGELAKKGVRILESEADIIACKDERSVIIIRSHGVSKQIKELIDKKAAIVIDATCPFVKRIHDIVWEKSNAGYEIVVIGSPGHPEVRGIMGWCAGPATVIEDRADAYKYTPNIDSHLFIVAQTTINHKKFKELVEILEKKGYNVTVANTICHATHERQEEAASIASRVDAMLVIGGKGSSNTAKLYSICMGLCERTYFLQTASDLPDSFPSCVKKIGITAGASTPQFIIEEVYQHVGTNF